MTLEQRVEWCEKSIEDLLEIVRLQTKSISNISDAVKQLQETVKEAGLIKSGV